MLLLCEYLYERAVRAVAVVCCLCARVTGKPRDCRSKTRGKAVPGMAPKLFSLRSSTNQSEVWHFFLIKYSLKAGEIDLQPRQASLPGEVRVFLLAFGGFSPPPFYLGGHFLLCLVK